MSHICNYTETIAYDGISCSNNFYKYYNLWGPQGASDTKWNVTKWKKPIQYVINDFTDEPQASSHLQEEIAKEIQKFAAAAGLSITSDPENGNVLIVISNNITETDSIISGAVRNLLLAAMGSGVNLNEMLAFHHKHIAEMTPRCGAALAANKFEGIVGAFVYLQTGEDERCVTIALTEMFGIGNSWNGLPGQNFTTSDIRRIKYEALTTVHEKYDPSVLHGMKNDEVMSVMAEHCK
ncbi:hypothetical protein [Methylocapsa acidiphila]|uniref:hypothetical protein n=1 Tax=Methylocapsa acidiphila TaxID=133552 RepID=UPI0012EBEAF9|nr:hypothetical protein [Methylocapsa acidiphila]